MPRCVIFTAGDQHGTKNMRSACAHDDFVICCDAGYRLAQRLGVRPDLRWGILTPIPGARPRISVQRYIRDKDDTDTVIAVRYALEHGYDSILLVAATGGRLDPSAGQPADPWPLFPRRPREQRQRSSAPMSGFGCWMAGAVHSGQAGEHLLSAVPQ